MSDTDLVEKYIPKKQPGRDPSFTTAPDQLNPAGAGGCRGGLGVEVLGEGRGGGGASPITLLPPSLAR